MTLKQVTVIKSNASYKELKALAELLKVRGHKKQRQNNS